MSNLLPLRYKLTDKVPDAWLLLKDINDDVLNGLDDEESALPLLNRAVLMTGELRIEALRKASEIDSEYREQALYWLGEALLDAGKNDEAMLAYRLALNSNVGPYTGLAQAALERLEAMSTTQ